MVTPPKSNHRAPARLAQRMRSQMSAYVNGVRDLGNRVIPVAGLST